MGRVQWADFRRRMQMRGNPCRGLEERALFRRLVAAAHGVDTLAQKARAR